MGNIYIEPAAGQNGSPKNNDEAKQASQPGCALRGPYTAAAATFLASARCFWNFALPSGGCGCALLAQIRLVYALFALMCALFVLVCTLFMMICCALFVLCAWLACALFILVRTLLALGLPGTGTAWA